MHTIIWIMLLLIMHIAMKNEENIAHLFSVRRAARGCCGREQQNWSLGQSKMDHNIFFSYNISGISCTHCWESLLLKRYIELELITWYLRRSVTAQRATNTLQYFFMASSSSEHKLLKGNSFYQETPHYFNILFILLDHPV